MFEIVERASAKGDYDQESIECVCAWSPTAGAVRCGDVRRHRHVTAGPRRIASWTGWGRASVGPRNTMLSINAMGTDGIYHRDHVRIMAIHLVDLPQRLLQQLDAETKKSVFQQ